MLIVTLKELKSPEEPAVIQVYLPKPLLIDKYTECHCDHRLTLVIRFKFDMRLYVLVAGCDPFRIFLFEGREA